MRKRGFTLIDLLIMFVMVCVLSIAAVGVMSNKNSRMSKAVVQEESREDMGSARADDSAPETTVEPEYTYATLDRTKIPDGYECFYNQLLGLYACCEEEKDGFCTSNLGTRQSALDAAWEKVLDKPQYWEKIE